MGQQGIGANMHGFIHSQACAFRDFSRRMKFQSKDT